MIPRRLNVPRLMRRLAEMNLTVEGFKAAVGLDRRTIERLLSGKTQNAQYQTIEVIARFLEVAPRELLFLPEAAEIVPLSVTSVSLPKVAGRLPVTGSLLLGREQELAWLQQAWSEGQANIVSIIAWGGVGKSALVTHWLGTLAQTGWQTVPRVFGWTFASQGVEDPIVAADEFMDTALRFFGDGEPHLGTPWDRGHRLAQLSCAQRTLLVLDGLETLQYPPGPQTGHITDPAMAALLQTLALHNPGLCVLTSRLAVADIAAFQMTTAAVLTLANLPEEAGGEFLQRLGCTGSQAERCTVAREYGGHALALQLLGNYVRDACGGDLRRRHEVALSADWSEASYAWSVMESYTRWLGPGLESTILQLLGLFDGVASAAALAALRAAPPLPALNDTLLDLPAAQWSYALRRLRQTGLLAPPDPTAPEALDTHPLIRAYYRHRLQTHSPMAWRAGHERLFTFYQASAVEDFPETLETLAPLYAAVAHGCLAGHSQEALYILRQRIRRGAQQFSLEQLGAFGIELATVAHAFAVPWSSPLPDLSYDDQLFVWYTAGECLSALGRVHEAMAPLQQALTLAHQQQHWTLAALATTKLSEAARAQGDLTASRRFAEQSTLYACRPGVPQKVHIHSHAFYGFALYWVGQVREAQVAFQEAERVQQLETPSRPLLHAVLGYMYSELLLDQLAGHAAHLPPQQFQATWQVLHTRLTQTLTFARQDSSLRDSGLQHISMGRLYTLAYQHAPALGLCPTLAQEQATTHFTQAIACLRVSNYHNYFPRTLLSRAVLLRAQGHFAQAHADVDAVLALARSSVMNSYQAEAYLEQACLFLAAYDAVPHVDQVYRAAMSLESAKSLINTMGYYRRSQQVEEVEAKLRVLVPSQDSADV